MLRKFSWKLLTNAEQDVAQKTASKEILFIDGNTNTSLKSAVTMR